MTFVVRSLTALVLFVVLLFSTYSHTLHAQDHDLNDVEEVLLYKEITENQSSSKFNQDFSDSSPVRLEFDPNQFDSAKEHVLTLSKEDWLKTLSEEIIEQGLIIQQEKSSYVIPRAPSKMDLLDHLLEMEADEISRFLDRKNNYLTGIAKGFSYIKMSPKNIQKTINFLNDEIYKSAMTVASGNQFGVNIGTMTGVGFGISQKLVEKINNSKVKKFIPKSGGFYFLVALGLGIYKRNFTGKDEWVIEVFADFEKLKSVKTWLLDASAAVYVGLATEKSSPTERIKKFETLYGGPAGTIRSGQGLLFWGSGLGPTIAPVINMSYIYINSATRVKLLKINLTKLNPKNWPEIFQSLVIMFKIKSGIIPSCRRVLSN